MRAVRVVTWGLAVIAFAVAWAVFAPAAALGSTTYLSAYGNSMLPYLKGGDLVVVRSADQYQVGDVVAYRNPLLENQIVLHRVVGMDGARLVMKGDHNTWLDEYRPAFQDVVGKEWFHVDGIGDVFGRLRDPANGATIFAVAGLFAIGAPSSISNWILGEKQRRRRPDGRRRKPRQRSAPGKVAALGIALAVLVVVTIASLAAYAYTSRQPATVSRTVSVPYTQVASYGWSGTARPGAVYPTGAISTGDPLFFKLAGAIKVRFTYVITSTEPVQESGTVAMKATVESVTTGWHRSVVLVPATAFRGKADVTGTLNVAGLRAMATAYERDVGLRADDLRVTVTAAVKATGTVGGAALSTELAPVLPFQLDSTVLKFDTTAAPDLGVAGQPAGVTLGSAPGTDQDRMNAILAPQSAATAVKQVRVLNHLGWLGVSVPVGEATDWSRWGLILSAAAMVLMALIVLIAIRGRDEAAWIDERYGSHIVPVGAIAALRNEGAIELTSMASLVRLAERHDRMILHEEREDDDLYALHDGELFYFYRTHSPAAEAATASGAR